MAARCGSSRSRSRFRGKAPLLGEVHSSVGGAWASPTGVMTGGALPTTAVLTAKHLAQRPRQSPPAIPIRAHRYSVSTAPTLIRLAMTARSTPAPQRRPVPNPPGRARPGAASAVRTTKGAAPGRHSGRSRRRGRAPRTRTSLGPVLVWFPWERTASDGSSSAPAWDFPQARTDRSGRP